MGDGTSEDKHAEEREGHDKCVKVTIIPSTNAIADPWTMMIESLCKERKEKNKKQERMFH